MNPKWLVPIALTLGLGLLGLAGASKQVAQVQLWLDKRHGPETAKASALAPNIDCMNRVDRDWRLFYYGYTHQEWYRPSIFDEQTYESLVQMDRILKEFGDLVSHHKDQFRVRHLFTRSSKDRITPELVKKEAEGYIALADAWVFICGPNQARPDGPGFVDRLRMSLGVDLGFAPDRIRTE